ncbi:MAG: hypothetical protein Q9226_006610 [Calogaya cf. arnoldii]
MAPMTRSKLADRHLSSFQATCTESESGQQYQETGSNSDNPTSSGESVRSQGNPRKRKIRSTPDSSASVGQDEGGQRNPKRRKISIGPGSPANQTSSAPVSDDFDKLIERVQGLPQELFDHIQNYVFELGLCPGFIFPYQPTLNGMHYWNGKLYPVFYPDLLRINKATRAKYQKLLWSENTWVIGIGLPHDTTHLFVTFGLENPFPITKAHLTFTFRDHPDTSYYPSSLNENPPHHLTRGCKHVLRDRVRTMNTDTAEHRDHFNNVLACIWTTKLRHVMYSDPTELTLDFSECYGCVPYVPFGWGLDKIWLGNRLAKDILITRPRPAKLHITGIENEAQRARATKYIQENFH